MPPAPAAVRDRALPAVVRALHRLEGVVERVRPPRAGPRPARPEAYIGYGRPDRVVVRARIVRDPPEAPASNRASALRNLVASLRRLASDEVPGARARVRIAGEQTAVVADEEGYVECWLEPDPPLPVGWSQARIEVLDPPDGEPAVARVLVPAPGARFLVVSDLDDTVIRSDVTSTVRMLATALLGNARTRSPFPGVAAFYRALRDGGGGDPNPIVYVSSSPWTFHVMLRDFLAHRRIPEGPLLLRDWGLDRTGFQPRGHRDHKLRAVRELLGLFPDLDLVFVGDSGQEDPEIALEAAREHPGRLRVAYIRDVHPSPERRRRVLEIAEEVRDAGSTLVLCHDTLAAARDAAARGLVPVGAVDEVAADAEGLPAPARAV